MLKSLNIQCVRNLRDVRLGALRRHNIIHGSNGTGKTSILEAVHLLGTARTFRGGSAKTLITHGQPRFVVYGEKRLSSGARSLGIQRGLKGDTALRIAGTQIRSVARLADELPLLLINADCFDLLVGQPGQRRRFLDWGAFHVEHDYRDAWRRFQRALTQRNHLLRRAKLDAGELDAWTRDLARQGTTIAEGRSRFLQALQPGFSRLMTALAPEIGSVDLAYRQGWDSSADYAEALQRSVDSDREQGFTQSGPQRADIRVTVGGYLAADTLSRGQQKLLVCALKLAQGEVLAERQDGAGLYLIDDLPSELDSDRCERVCRCLAQINAQTLITCVDADAIPPRWLGPEEDVALFHVEHGEVRDQ